jgi:hypothetical protein
MRVSGHISLVMLWVFAVCVPTRSQAPRPDLRPDRKLDSAERQRVVDAVAREVREHFVDRAAAGQVADAIVTHAAHGDDDAAADPAALASLLTKQLRDASHDLHFEVAYSENPLPERREPTPEDQARFRQIVKQQHCAIEKVGLLPHKISYLKLNFFPDPATCEQDVREAMAQLNTADAVIVDLRDNRGGMPEMTELVAAYFFDRPVDWFNPRGDTAERTPSPVAGSKLADEPVYVLTSQRTISGAEQFCYDLKMLKRATLVGETTAGAAHAGVFHRIDEHFGVAVPEVRPSNPYGQADWEGAGVAPDVPVAAEAALKTALALAEAKLEGK